MQDNSVMWQYCTKTRIFNENSTYIICGALDTTSFLSYNLYSFLHACIHNLSFLSNAVLNYVVFDLQFFLLNFNNCFQTVKSNICWLGFLYRSTDIQMGNDVYWYWIYRDDIWVGMGTSFNVFILVKNFWLKYEAIEITKFGVSPHQKGGFCYQLPYIFRVFVLCFILAVIASSIHLVHLGRQIYMSAWYLCTNVLASTVIARSSSSC